MILWVAWLACAPDEPGVGEAPEYGLTDAPYTTLQAVWAPLIPDEALQASIEAGELEITDHAQLLDAGLGVELVEGESWVERTELAPDFVEGTDRRSVAYLWQAADPQLIDEESPIRMEGFEQLYRPQGHLTVQVFEAHVRTAQRISDASGRPFDFALLAGDLTDGSQLNELGWVLTTLGGGVLDPDSGADDDPVDGPGNDYNDPFSSAGLSVPWYAAIGNHETQYNGGFGVIDEALLAAAIGAEVYDFPLFTNGFRDGSTIDAEIRLEGPTPADPRRVVLGRHQVLAELFAAPGLPLGHGLSADAVALGHGYFSTWPISGAPLRLIVLDTVNTYGGLALGEGGVIDLQQFDWLQGELADADNQGELVVVMSHHKSGDIIGTSEVSGDELIGALAASEGVVLHVTGHGHANEAVTPADTLAVDHGYWELMLASTIDYPMQSRVIELVDERNGYLSIYTTNLDHNAPTDSLSHHARQLAAAKKALGTVLSGPDIEGFWDEDRPAQNLLLRVALPDAIADTLGAYDGSEVIESETTLSGLATP